jgi:hypothetical protein
MEGESASNSPGQEMRRWPGTLSGPLLDSHNYYPVLRANGQVIALPCHVPRPPDVAASRQLGQVEAPECPDGNFPVFAGDCPHSQFRLPESCKEAQRRGGVPADVSDLPASRVTSKKCHQSMDGRREGLGVIWMHGCKPRMMVNGSSSLTTQSPRRGPLRSLCRCFWPWRSGPCHC